MKELAHDACILGYGGGQLLHACVQTGKISTDEPTTGRYASETPYVAVDCAIPKPHSSLFALSVIVHMCRHRRAPALGSIEMLEPEDQSFRWLAS
jgi:hypothetical protein